MANRFLDHAGLSHFWDAIKAALKGKQDNLTFDDMPKAGSSNPVKSGGVYTAIANIGTGGGGGGGSGEQEVAYFDFAYDMMTEECTTNCSYSDVLSAISSGKYVVGKLGIILDPESNEVLFTSFMPVVTDMSIMDNIVFRGTVMLIEEESAVYFCEIAVTFMSDDTAYANVVNVKSSHGWGT